MQFSHIFCLMSGSVLDLCSEKMRKNQIGVQVGKYTYFHN